MLYTPYSAVAFSGASTSVSLDFMLLCKCSLKIILTSLYLVEGLAWWDWPFTWCTDQMSSFSAWHCWLGHLTRKNRPRKTYNVFGGTLNHTLLLLEHWNDFGQMPFLILLMTQICLTVNRYQIPPVWIIHINHETLTIELLVLMCQLSIHYSCRWYSCEYSIDLPLWFCLSVYICPSVCTIKPKRLKLKSPNLAQGWSIMNHDTSLT